MNTAVHFSSASCDWSTPRDFFAQLHAEFGFTLDVCAAEENACVPRYFDTECDGLEQDWSGERCWMNPPYGDPEQPCSPVCTKKRCVSRGFHIKEYVPGIRDWVAKAATCGALVVALLPARTDTRWWHDYVWDADQNQSRPGVEVRLLRGRLKFGAAKASAPFPSAVVVFRPREAPHAS